MESRDTGVNGIKIFILIFPEVIEQLVAHEIHRIVGAYV